MELTMTNSFGFCELNENEMMMVDGGSAVGIASATFGIIAIGHAPLIGILAGMACMTPGVNVAVAVVAGVSAASMAIGTGLICVDAAMK